jgi:aspartokinase/homoserine dehydrogenase 1
MIEKRKDIKLNVLRLPIRNVLLNKKEFRLMEKTKFETNGSSYTIDDVIAYANEHHRT